MPTDPRTLKPGDVCRLLNSTPLGEVISERQLFRHRARGGARVGDGKRVDLLRYAAWLVATRHAPKAPPADYDAVKARARERNRTLSLAGRDIGPLPAVGNPERRAKAEKDFRVFCDCYFRRTFHLPWSPDHLKVIAKIEKAVLRGGLFAVAMPRGSGKSSLAEVACVWAVLYGHRDFVALIGSDEGHAAAMLESIKAELDGNDLLLEDFPEVCHPIRALDGIANRCGGQLLDGTRTHIGWTAKEVVLPSVAGSAASGAVIKVAGLTGRIRGMKFKRPDGRTVRPSLVVLDDPQTDESARSLTQCATREAILAGAVLGLAGPGCKIAGIMPCTVIRPGDMADAILDGKKHPEWNGERTKMVYAFPSDDALWRQYAEVRADGLRAGDGGEAGTRFYADRRAAMDAGAVIAWPERFDPGEASAIQHAMNLRLRDEAAFFAEYQNEPLPDAGPAAGELTAEQIAGKLSGVPRGIAPAKAQHLTAFVDVHGDLLYWAVCGWADDFTGWVVDYGTYPDQHRTYFALRDARVTLAAVTGEPGLEASIRKGLDGLTAQILGRAWPREDGSDLRVAKCLVDANWGSSTDVVYQFCRHSPFPGVLVPCHGRYVGAASRPFSEYTDKPGDRAGHHWRVPAPASHRGVRHALVDVNYWKSFVHSRLAVPAAEPGSLTLFGMDAAAHRLFADHAAAETRVRTDGRGRSVDEWRPRPGGGDNHWLDCLVGGAAAASMLGVTLPVHGGAKRPAGPKRSLSEMQRNARTIIPGRPETYTR